MKSRREILEKGVHGCLAAMAVGGAAATPALAQPGENPTPQKFL